jgi:uncharacterized protein (DUF736 family)
MATIGTFRKTDKGSYTGTLKTLTLTVRTHITKSPKTNDQAPDYRIFVGPTEFGAAWLKTSRDGREYLSVRMDDPSFPAPIFASLVEGEGDEFSLIWSRRSGE